MSILFFHLICAIISAWKIPAISVVPRTLNMPAEKTGAQSSIFPRAKNAPGNLTPLQTK